MVTGGIDTFNFEEKPFSINFLKFGNKFSFNRWFILSKHPPSIPNIIFFI